MCVSSFPFPLSYLFFYVIFLFIDDPLARFLLSFRFFNVFPDISVLFMKLLFRSAATSMILLSLLQLMYQLINEGYIFYSTNSFSFARFLNYSGNPKLKANYHEFSLLKSNLII